MIGVTVAGVLVNVGVQVAGGGGGGGRVAGGVGVKVRVRVGSGVLVRVFVGRTGSLVSVGGAGGDGGAGRVEVGETVFVMVGGGVGVTGSVLVGPEVAVMLPLLVGVGVLALGVPGVFDAPGPCGVGVSVTWPMAPAVDVGGTQKSPTTTVPCSSLISSRNASSSMLIGTISPYCQG